MAVAGRNRLSEEEIQAAMPRVPGWERRGDAIVRSYKFADFKGAMGFVNRVAELAEKANHHPDILIQYSKVTLTLSTHSAGGLTDKDFELAAQIDRL